MATNGLINGTTSSEFIAVRVEWSVSQNKSINVSNLRVDLKYKRTNTGYETYGTGTFYLNINGTSRTATKTLKITEDAWVTALSTEVQIEHNDRGEATVKITGTGSIPGTTLTNSLVQGTISLPTIPRASIITTLKDRTLGEACSVAWTPLSSRFTYKLTFSLGSWSHTTGVIAPNRTSLYTYTGYTLPLDVANQLPKAATGEMTVILATYSDANGTVQVGSNSTETFIVTVPDNSLTQPKVSMSLSPSSDLLSPYNELYIQGHSKLKATLGFSTQYGASVEASSIVVDGNTYPSPYESDILSKAGKVSVKATATDSRGFYGTNYGEIEVIPYSKPYIRAKSDEESIIVARCDKSANFTDSGTYLKIKAKVVYSKVITNAGVQTNYANIKFRYRIEGGNYGEWQTILNCKTDNSDEVITPPLLNGALDIKSNYQVQIIASDDLYDSVPITFAISSDAVYMDRPSGGKSMGLGGYSSGDGNLDIHWKTNARGGLSLFDSKGDEIPLDTTMPLPRDQIKGEWNADDLANGVHVVANNNALKAGDTVIMNNGVLLQMNGDVSGNVKLQLALPVDEDKSPMYRLCWYSNWSAWRSLKL